MTVSKRLLMFSVTEFVLGRKGLEDVNDRLSLFAMVTSLFYDLIHASSCCFSHAERNWRLHFFIEKEHGELQLRSDLLDCHVDVCSPEVLVQLSDNFDYQASYGD